MVKYSTKLSDSDYSRFLLQLINDDNTDLAYRIENNEDKIRITLSEPTLNEYHQVELNMKTNEFISEFNDTRLYEGYINGEYNLAFAETNFDYLSEKVIMKANQLQANNINADPEHILHFNNNFNSSTFEIVEQLKEPKQDLNELIIMQNEIENKLLKINDLIQEVEAFESEYVSENHYINDLVYGENERINSIVNLADSYRDMQEHLHHENEFLKYAIKYETENYLVQKDQTLDSIDLDKELSIKLAVTISENSDLERKHILPMIAESHLNNPFESIKQHIQNYQNIEYLDHALKNASLFSGSNTYEGEKLNHYIQDLKQYGFEQTVERADNRMKHLYGEHFHLLSKDDIKVKKSDVIKFLEPVVKTESFKLNDIRNYINDNEKIFPSKSIQQFWDNKSFNMLNDYVQKHEELKVNFDNTINNNEQLSNVKERINTLAMEQNPFTDRTLDKIKNELEQSIFKLSSVSTNLKLDLTVNNESVEGSYKNQLVQNLSYIEEHKGNLESMKMYADMVKGEPESELDSENEL